MSKFLASVNSLAEAQQILEIGVDIIDLKQPAQGALGALDYPSISQILQHVARKCPVSATIGDLPMHPETVFNAVNTMAQTGVDYIKIGFFPDGNWQNCITQLAAINANGHSLIAVLFADAQPPFEILEALHQANFKGVMLDTMNKSSGSLTEVMPVKLITQFVALSKHYGLLCGLAGSLKLTDISKLAPLNADYLGFRGALCHQQERTARLNPEAIRILKKQLLAH